MASRSTRSAYEIFEADEHGYDAELGAVAADEVEYTDDLISSDVEIPHEIVVRYELPSDHLGGEARYQGREHDLFSWFTLLARDPKTKRLAFLFDIECA